MGSDYISIAIKGRKVGLKFGLLALRQLHQKEKTVPFYITTPSADNPSQMVETYSDLAYAHILYAGYCNNQYIKNEALTISFESFYDIVEACFNDSEKVVSTLRPVIECFENSRYIAPLASKAPETEIKKKSSPSTKSKASATES